MVARNSLPADNEGRPMPAHVVEIRTIHAGWTKLRIARIALADGQSIMREIEDHGRAVAVLPYDPERRVVMLVRQLRAPMLVAAGLLDSLEAPAGILDSPDPAECARREAMEECGLRLGSLEPLVRAWSMPGVSTETMDLFLAPYSAADRVEAGGGLAEEHEQIEVVEMNCAELAAMIDGGRLVDMKTLVLALSLRQRHPHLFA
jgi:nudix-type nucleoside diphosphatase (YffH/AdpP family)